MGGNSGDTSGDTSGDDPVRERVRALYEKLATEKLATEKLGSEKFARKLERAVYNACIRSCREDRVHPVQPVWENPAFRYRYTTKALSIQFNLKNEKNPGLMQRLVSGEISPKDLCVASPEKMWPEFWGPIRERVAIKALKRQLTVDVENHPDGAFQCRKCKSKKTAYYEMQTRAADEPMTVFIQCVACGNRWKS